MWKSNLIIIGILFYTSTSTTCPLLLLSLLLSIVTVMFKTDGSFNILHFYSGILLFINCIHIWTLFFLFWNVFYILLLILFNLVFSTATVLSIFFIPNLINSKLYSSLYSHIFLILKFILFYILNFNWSRVLDVSCPYFLFRTSVIYKLYSYRALVQNFLYVMAFPVSGACGPSHRHHL